MSYVPATAKPAIDLSTILEPMITLIMMVMIMKMMTKMMEGI